MLKKIIFTSLFLLSSQNIMALNLGDVTSTAETAKETKETADNLGTAKKAANKLQDGSMTDTAKEVVTDGAKGGVEGAVDGAKSGSITEGATEGAMDGAKSALD
jgi:hypothetical protein